MEISEARDAVQCHSGRWFLLQNCVPLQPLKYWTLKGKNKNIKIPYNPAIPPLGIYPKKPGVLIGKNISTPMFTAALFRITKIGKQLKYPSVGKWIKQLWDIYTMECYLAIKKKKLPFATTWMDLENIMLSEISQSEKDKYHLISLICGI